LGGRQLRSRLDHRCHDRDYTVGAWRSPKVNLRFYNKLGMFSPRLELRQVSKIYSSDGQKVEALRNVSLRLEAGTVTALVGRSGCGKSTLLNLAGAMDFPTSGEVLIDGRSTSSLSESELTTLRRKRIGFVFQFFQLLPTLTVLENVELPLLLAGEV